jgi:hypothetical protein
MSDDVCVTLREFENLPSWYFHGYESSIICWHHRLIKLV